MDSSVAILAIFQMGSPSNKQMGKSLRYYCATESKRKQVLAKTDHKASKAARAE